MVNHIQPFRRPRRGVPTKQLSGSEMMMLAPGLRRRMLTFAPDATLARAIRVCRQWFEDAAAVLYNQMEVKVALSLAPKMSPRYIEYNSVVRQISQQVSTKQPTSPPQTGTPEYPFLPIDLVSLSAAADAAPMLFPMVHSVVTDIEPGHLWGINSYKKGGDRSFLSFIPESGYAPDTLYVERCIGVSTTDFKLDSEVFRYPSIEDFDTELCYVIIANGSFDTSKPTQTSAILPFESMIPLNKLRHPVVAVVTKGVDVHIRTIIKLFSSPLPSLWPFDTRRGIDCDRVLGLGLKEFQILAQTGGVKDIPIIRLTIPCLPHSGTYFRPSDIYSLRQVLIKDLPDLKELAISIVMDDQSEMEAVGDQAMDLPVGPLARLDVHLWSKERASSSTTAFPTLSFPFNLIRRLAVCVKAGGALVLHGTDLPGRTPTASGMDLSGVISWIRARPPQVRRLISTMNYAALGVTCSNDLSRLCYEFGNTPMTLPHSLAYYFTSDLLTLIDRHLRDPVSRTAKSNLTQSIIQSRARAFELNNYVVECHWQGLKSDKVTLAARAAKVLWECKNAGMAEAPTTLTTKYPTFFDGLRKAAQTAAEAAKVREEVK